jgi:conjugative transfer signal peptidase TraF
MRGLGVVAGAAAAATTAATMAGGRGGRRPGRRGGRRWRAGVAVAGTIVGGLGLALGLGARLGPGRGLGFGPGRGGLCFNSSPSLPRGLYLLGDGGGARPGDLVLACPPAAFGRLAVARGYLRRGGCPGGSRPLGKVLLAVAGDRLAVGAGAIALDGRRLAGTATVAADREGRPLPRVAGGERRVAAGEVWVISAHPRSLDSRYFGPIGAGQVIGRLVPLLTGGGADAGALAAEIRQARAGGARGGRLPTAPTRRETMPASWADLALDRHPAPALVTARTGSLRCSTPPSSGAAQIAIR